MGEPFRAFYVEHFVGHCDSCGLASKGWGVQSGRAATVCQRCAEDITRVVSERAAGAMTTAQHIDGDGVAFPSATRTKRARIKRAA